MSLLTQLMQDFTMAFINTLDLMLVLLFQKGKIPRDQLVRKMRQVAGDDLLAQIIKNHKDRV